MLRLLHAAFVTASLQLVAIVIVTLCVLLFAPRDMNCPAAPATVEACDSWNATSLFLIWTYLLIAIGLALTRNRSIEITANRIRNAFSLTALAGREQTLMSLVVQPIACAIALAVVALQSPPGLVLWAVSHFGPTYAAPIIWGAAMSVGVASAGAVAHAALKALYKW
jgi:hypothetical protein